MKATHRATRYQLPVRGLPGKNTADPGRVTLSSMYETGLQNPLQRGPGPEIAENFDAEMSLRTAFIRPVETAIRGDHRLPFAPNPSRR